MKLIKFRDVDGDPIFFNPEMITCIRGADGGTWIHIAGQILGIKVQESIEEVVKAVICKEEGRQ